MVSRGLVLLYAIVTIERQDKAFAPRRGKQVMMNIKVRKFETARQ